MHKSRQKFSALFAISLAHFVTASGDFSTLSDCVLNKKYVTFVCGSENKTDYIFRQVNFFCSNGISRYSPIQKIDFDNCLFRDIDSALVLGRFPQIEAYDTSNVGLTAITMKDPPKSGHIKVFDASHNELTTFPNDVFCSIVSLQSLDISYNSITQIEPANLDCAKNLTALNMSFNKLRQIPAHLFKVAKNVKILNLSGNALEGVPHDAFVDATGMTSLDLSNCSLKSIEDHLFDELKNLTHLNLSSNPIGNVKIGAFAYLTDLEHLDLRQTKISNMAIGTLSFQWKLISLDLSENQLKSLDFSLFFPVLRHLKSLRLGNNQLQTLSGFANALFPKLMSLDIKNNRFKCDYLKELMNSVNWTILEIPLDPKAIDREKTNIRGINCEATA